MQSKIALGALMVLCLMLGAPAQASSRAPSMHLKIPKIKVDAVIESVGLTPLGAVGVPKGPVNAGLFDGGPRPGEVGSAVIDGHVGVWKNGVATVFNRLAQLQKGDEIFVVDEKGATSTFEVREFRAYDPHEDVPEVFDSSDGGAHLNLITCGGVWNKMSKSYSKRLVVFTDKV